jgi:hypothetical protein
MYSAIIDQKNSISSQILDLYFKEGKWYFWKEPAIICESVTHWLESMQNAIVCRLDEIEEAFDAGWKIQEEYGGMSVSHPMFRKWLKQNYPSLAGGI